MADTSKSIVIKLLDDQSAENAANLRVYAVNGQGKVVETAGFHGRTAQVSRSVEASGPTRLFVGPSFPEEYPADSIDAYALAQAGAYQLSTTGGRNEIAVAHLPPGIVRQPPFHFCNVQGNVANTLNINGFTQTGPVCKARVHICTVDWYWRWPIWLRPVIPVRVIEQLQEVIGAHRIQPRNLAANGPKRLPVALEDQLLSATSENILDVISAHAEIIRPYFCYYPIFWPWFYRLVEREVVSTDCNGHFDGWLISLGAAQENLYVWVEANINGNWVTVYRPPYPCNTHWNYACGSEINISLADAAIPPCNCGVSVGDGTVWFTAIGAYGIATAIQQNLTSTAAILDGSGATLRIPNVGCTDLFEPNGNQLAPFGGALDLGLATGPTFPAGATHYRWSWKYLQDSAGNPQFGTPTAIGGSVSRPYLYPITSGNWEPGSVPLNDTDTLGNTAYFLPDYLPTSYATVPPLAEWVAFNFVSASLDSHQFLDGYVVQFSLELLQIVGGEFKPVAVAPNTFQVSNNTDASDGYGGSSPAPASYLSVDAAGDSIFTLNVRIDNAKVTAQLNDAMLLDGSGNPVPGGSSGPCGFITFTSASQDVSLSFNASGAFGYAYFGYSLFKGDSGDIISLSNDYVFETEVPFTLNGDSYAFSQSGSSGNFSAAPSVTDLLSGCPQAAFGVNLSVYSLATNGSGALWESGPPYAASSAIAFALTPAPTTT